MNKLHDASERICAGETASIENTNTTALSISISAEDGFRLDMTIAPGQVLELTAGRSGVDLTLHHGDPAGLLVIKPESAS